MHARTKPPVRNDGKLGQSRKWTSGNPQNDVAAKAGATLESVCLDPGQRLVELLG